MSSRFNERIQTFISDTKDIVTLPNIDQSVGKWGRKFTPHECCFGARVAKALGAKHDARYDVGKKHMKAILDLTETELCVILYVCGTGRICSFDTVDWANEPETVYERLLKIERKPTPYEISKAFDCWQDVIPFDDKRIQDIYQSLCKPLNS